jgi:hypothetical protein
MTSSSSAAKQNFPTLNHVRLTGTPESITLFNQQRAFLFCRLVTCAETETAAPLKSEIGDGRRRLLFRDAEAAMSLSLCSASPLSLSLSLLAVPALVLNEVLRNKSEKDGPALFTSDGWLCIACLKLLVQSVLMEHRKRSET